MDEPTSVAYLRWIPLLPLLGAALNGVAGAPLQRRFGKGVVTAIACLPVAAAFLLACRAFNDLLALPAAERLLLDRVWTWIDVGALRVDAAFAIDPLAAVMALVVTGVGGLIHVYSAGYMHDEPSYWRYFALLNLFTAMMLILVLADNLLLLFVGWEGVGLCSYALIGFWYANHDNATAGSKAFIVNRIGDFGFTLGMFLLFWTMSAAGHPTLAFRELGANAHVLADATFLGWGAATVITALMFVGATGKSAQIPLYVWLPDAMAGPTPVSALIHAATMVTAGVYLIARLDFLFVMAPATLAVIAWVGALTALLAATIGTVQTDIKKVLAYSTISQLGYMVLALGVAAPAAAVFHLMTHAFFKACLFLGAGSVIFALHHEQDLRRMGGLRAWMPVTYGTFLVSTLAIAGFPPFSGFFSKDEILWKAFSSEQGGVALWFVGWLAAGLTAFYMFRLVFLAFHGDSRIDAQARRHLAESPASMTVPLVVLAAFAVVAGFVGVPAALGGSNRIEHWLAPAFAATTEHGAHHSAALEYGLMALSVGAGLAGLALAHAMYVTGRVSADLFARFGGGVPYRLATNKYYVDEIYQAVFVAGVLRLSRLGAAFDARVVDAAVNGVAAVVRGVSRANGGFDRIVVDGFVDRVADATLLAGGVLRRLQTGSINLYLYAIVAGVVVVMIAKLL